MRVKEIYVINVVHTNLWASSRYNCAPAERSHKNNFINMRHPCKLTAEVDTVCIETHVIRQQNKLLAAE